MSDPFLGNVMLIAFDFVPKFFASCNGALLPINQNQALFALLGTTYGGNGTTTFALPDLRSRVPVGFGQGPGLNVIQIGERAGVESVTVLGTHMPVHRHPLNVQSGAGTTSVPGTGTVLAQTVVGDGTPVPAYSNTVPDTTLAATSIGSTGSSTPVNIRNPYLGLQYIICTSGIFPSRN